MVQFCLEVTNFSSLFSTLPAEHPVTKWLKDIICCLREIKVKRRHLHTKTISVEEIVCTLLKAGLNCPPCLLGSICPAGSTDAPGTGQRCRPLTPHWLLTQQNSVSGGPEFVCVCQSSVCCSREKALLIFGRTAYPPV